jgi:hypothetical protein
MSISLQDPATRRRVTSALVRAGIAVVLVVSLLVVLRPVG